MKAEFFSEKAAFLILSGLRWPKTDGLPVCPRCDASNDAYWLRTRKAFKCRRCFKQFSMMSGTVFAHHKLSLGQCCTALLLFEDSGGEVTAAEIARHLGVTYKTAFVLKSKMCEGQVNEGGPMGWSSFLYRGYWSGYNDWRIEDGAVMRYNKHGDSKLVGHL